MGGGHEGYRSIGQGGIERAETGEQRKNEEEEGRETKDGNREKSFSIVICAALIILFSFYFVHPSFAHAYSWCTALYDTVCISATI